MDKQRWQQVDTLLNRALDFDDAREQAAFLHTACGEDEELMREVHALLDSIEASEAFWEKLLVSNQVLMADMTGGVPSVERDVPVQPDRRQEVVSRGVEIPEQVGPYALKKMLGRGGMGDVFLAGRTDEDFHQNVALKLIRQEFGSGDQVRRFLQERTILSGLNHPHIARLLDGGVTDDGRPWFVMEYVEDGLPVTEYCRRHDSSLEERLALFMQVCRAVQYAHSNFIVHRDLKPDNLLVDREEQVKVLDFGIAKLLDRDLDEQTLLQTQPGQRMMSLNYAAPEQLTMDPITTATDVYALGLLLFELLTDTRVFPLQGKKLSEAEWIIRNQEPPRPGTVSPRWKSRLRGDLDAIVLKALRKEAKHRYASASHLQEDIQRYLNSRPVSARKGTYRYRFSRFAKRNKVALTATSLFLVAAGGFGIWHVNQMAEQRDIAQQEAEKAEQISTFLTDLFQASDPDLARSESITARELLDKGTERIEGLAGEPEIQAAMMDVMGRAYRNLGLYDEAEPLLEAVVERYLQKNGSARESEQLASGLVQLGQLRIDQRRLEEAEELVLDALSVRKMLYDDDHPEIAGTLNSLSFIYVLQGEIDNAEKAALDALEMKKNFYPPDAKEIATGHTALGRIYQQRRDQESAEKHFIDAITILRGHYPEAQRELATNINHLGQVCHNQARYDEARELYMEAYQMMEKLLGADHTLTVDIYNNLGALLNTEGLHAEAAEIFREVLESRRRTVGENHALYGHTLFNLGSVYRTLGKFDEARSAFEDALEIRQAVYGIDHYQVGALLWHLGRLLHKDLSHDQEAEQMLNRAVNIHQEFLQEDHPSLGVLLQHYGNVLLDLGRHEEALVHLHEAHAILTASFDDENPYVQETARLLNAAGESSALRIN